MVKVRRAFTVMRFRAENHLLLLIVCVVNTRSQGQQSIGEPLAFPDIVDTSSSSGAEGTVEEITLTIEYATHTNAALTLQNARLFNGTLPGPTIVVAANDTLQIQFRNLLETQPDNGNDINEFRVPDDSNLHFHGLHVSGELPSDDVRLHVLPGQSYLYQTRIPANHHPGTHWIHPHVHGSSSFQVGGGAALALIVKDPDGYLPSDIANAPEQLLLVQTMNHRELGSVMSDSGDAKFRILPKDPSSLPSEYRIVNGQYQPEMSMETGQWTRWRIIHAGWLRDPLNLRILPSTKDGSSSTSCEMVLLAKDGIYIADFPRSVSMLPIPTGGRADVLVRCDHAGSYTVQDGFRQTVWTIRVSGHTSQTDFLESWTPTYPDYLKNVVAADPGCACTTRMQGRRSCRGNGRFCINGQPFDPNVFLHTIPFGSMVTRTVHGIESHPYHQHVYPFQIVDNLNNHKRLSEDQKAYFQQGDWQDVIMLENSRDNSVQVRYQASVHTGSLFLHCHRLDHEDQGMMAQENVVEGGVCECTSAGAAMGPLVITTTLAFASAALLVAM